VANVKITFKPTKANNGNFTRPLKKQITTDEKFADDRC
jgi:hypothetical protein